MEREPLMFTKELITNFFIECDMIITTQKISCEILFLKQKISKCKALRQANKMLKKLQISFFQKNLNFIGPYLLATSSL